MQSTDSHSGLPDSLVRRVESSWPAALIFRASSWKRIAFSAPGIRHHETCAARAAFTAASTSSGLQSLTTPNGARVAGFRTSRVWAADDFVQLPLMSKDFGDVGVSGS